MPATLDERELIERSLSGDREAFRVIVLRYQGLLAEVVLRQTGDRSAVEDLVQEAFLRAYGALDRFDPRFALSTWLARIALNVARDQGRRRQVREAGLERLAVAPPGAGGGETPDEAVARREAAAQVEKALATLPVEQREVVVLSVWGGLSQREIAAAREVPLGTVKSRMRAAFAKLRDLVAPLGPGGVA